MPLFGLVAVSCIVTYAAQANSVIPLVKLSIPLRLGNALLAYVGYLGKTIWPADLAVFYPHPGATISVAQAIAAGLFLALLTALALGPGRRWRYLAVGWLWFLGTLVPVIGLVQIGAQSMADRYTYIPLVGLFVLATWGVSDLLAAWRTPLWVSVAAAATTLSACVALTWTQVGYWETEMALWEHTLAVTENNALAHINYGTACYRRDLRPLAKKHFEMAVAIEGRNARAHHNLGDILWKEGRSQEAVQELRRAVELDPTNARFLYNLGTVLAYLGKQGEAEAVFRRSIESDSKQADAHRHLGLLLQADGRLSEALGEYHTAVELGDDTAKPLRQRCEQYLRLRERLPAVIRGDASVAGAEALELAWLCQEPFERRYAQAARFFAVAFDAEPSLANTWQPRHRYVAARSACRASGGEGDDAATLDERDKSRLRGQALAWLHADLSLSSQRLQAATELQQCVEIIRMLRLWQQDPALDGVRNPSRLEKLPQPEREAWQSLWREHEAVLNTAGRNTR